MKLLIDMKELNNYRSREPVPIQCKQCQDTFYRPKNYVQKVLAKKYNITLDFCGNKCSYIHRRKRIIINCGQCQKPIERLANDLNRTKKKILFCDKTCAAIYNNEHRKLNRPNKIEYRNHALKHLPNQCNICGYNKFLSVLEVHHIDRDRTNNSIENLEILCPNCHAERHLLTKTGQFSQTKYKAQRTPAQPKIVEIQS